MIGIVASEKKVHKVHKLTLEAQAIPNPLKIIAIKFSLP